MLLTGKKIENLDDLPQHIQAHKVGQTKPLAPSQSNIPQPKVAPKPVQKPVHPQQQKSPTKLKKKDPRLSTLSEAEIMDKLRMYIYIIKKNFFKKVLK